MKLTLNPGDKFQEGLSILLLITNVLLVTWFLPSLPDTIPIHFDDSGHPNGYGNKNIMWLISLIPLPIYALLTFLGFRPDLYKSRRFTEKNKEQQLILVSKMLRVLKLGILMFFNVLTLFIIQTAQGKWTNMIAFPIAVLFAFIFPPIFYYLSKLSKVQ